MKSFNTFVIYPPKWDQSTTTATFSYSFDEEVFFEESVNFGAIHKKFYRSYDDFAYILLVELSIALGISYYKSYPTATIHLEGMYFDSQKASFWQNFYLFGLGEFRYRNELDPIIPQFVGSNVDPIIVDKQSIASSDSYLLCRGGGKDSIVSASLLDSSHCDYDIWAFGRTYSIHQHTAQILGKGLMVVPRTISPNLGNFVKEGYYNGHVPITGIIHFVSQLMAYLYGYKAVIFSNERSANFGNTVRRGLEINHQWSKSFSFEQSFEAYRQKFLYNAVSCFSILRPWNEIAIVQKFSLLSSFFPHFSSCNTNFRLDSFVEKAWCNKCPKCLFVYTLLRPFINDVAVQNIRGSELYNDNSLLPLFKQLRGVEGIKPFECVGEYDEMQYATWLYLQKSNHTSLILDFFASVISPTRVPDDWQALGEDLLHTYSEHIIPSNLVSHIL